MYSFHSPSAEYLAVWTYTMRKFLFVHWINYTLYIWTYFFLKPYLQCTNATLKKGVFWTHTEYRNHAKQFWNYRKISWNVPQQCHSFWACKDRFIVSEFTDWLIWRTELRCVERFHGFYIDNMNLEKCITTNKRRSITVEFLVAQSMKIVFTSMRSPKYFIYHKLFRKIWKHAEIYWAFIFSLLHYRGF